MDREAQLCKVFVELADTLVAGFDVADFLHTLTQRCEALFDVDAAGLLLAGDQGEFRVVAASAEKVELLELFQLQNKEGPCLDSCRSGVGVLAADLAVDSEQWPRFARAAQECGFRAVQALPLRLRGEVIGALNLFRAMPGGLDGHELAVCQAIADVATIGLLQARALQQSQVLANQLSAALNSRVVIEQAKGILAERGGNDMDAAFRLLRTQARRGNRRLADVARDVVERRLDLSPEAASHRS